MSELSERDLVIAAIKSGVTGCFEWDDKGAERVRGDSVFVEMELIDPDPEWPSVTIFNAHPQTK
ncbi:MAG: hypothetical protein L0Y72_22990 [Gemmataceae bacterium]|nr:hypothetical protein [Gemmataceae bacterium]MCI0741910.1 hypothetical protein [Gemmataceae bacterium]